MEHRPWVTQNLAVSGSPSPSAYNPNSLSQHQRSSCSCLFSRSLCCCSPFCTYYLEAQVYPMVLACALILLFFDPIIVYIFASFLRRPFCPYPHWAFLETVHMQPSPHHLPCWVRLSWLLLLPLPLLSRSGWVPCFSVSTCSPSWLLSQRSSGHAETTVDVTAILSKNQPQWGGQGMSLVHDFKC